MAMIPIDQLPVLAVFWKFIVPHLIQLGLGNRTQGTFSRLEVVYLVVVLPPNRNLQVVVRVLEVVV